MYWDDESHAKVKKLQLTFDHNVIYSIHVTYDGTALQSQRRGSVGRYSAEFTLDSDEYITAFSTYELHDYDEKPYVAALTFMTNKRTLGPYGKKSSFKHSSPAKPGKQIVGFLGTLGVRGILQTIHGHYGLVPTRTGTETESGAHKLDAKGGVTWDDGSDHDGVRTIYVRSGGEGIQCVKFDYVKGRDTKLGVQHGEFHKRGLTKEIEINHPDEYIVSVEGFYDSSSIILGIQFKTNKKTSEFFGYVQDEYGTGTKFTLQVQDKKIIGFHGFATNHLNSIGAYFIPLSSTPTPSTPVKKLKAKGGETKAEWDDGHHDDVKKVYVGQGQDGISAVKFEYKNGSKVVFGVERGKSTLLGFEEFELESDEYITSVEGNYENVYGVDGGVIVTMLIFNTNKDRTSGQLGLESSTWFELKEEGYKIVGFHGRAGETINAIGAYLAPLGTIPLNPATSSQKHESEPYFPSEWFN